ncbi:hypothetical protein C8Q80DRAFT_1123012 [Daedaleopsis nitida]|nr:hypothetical protein C8Q80DRAFT_1123012 [Daedaleopsis nitida]
MQWLIYFREASLTVACITAIIAHAMSSLTINLSVGVFTGPIQYAHLGVGAGVATITSLPLILLYDMAQERSYAGTVLAELIWMLGLIVVWIVVGVKTMGVTSSTFKTCTFDNATLSGVCTDAQTLVVFALLSAGVLALYTAALGIVATMQASSGKPIWTEFKMAKPKRR